MLILLIETATVVCSVALANDNKILAEVHSEEPNAHSSKLSPFIEQIFAQCGKKVSQLDAVCVSSGPGSYTGLRIGVSTAKGLCYALGKPLLAVPTLQGMAAQYYAMHPEYRGMVCPMIDARRMECYTAIYGPNAEELKAVSADIIEKIQDGTIDIEEYDETTRNNIKYYQTWLRLATIHSDVYSKSYLIAGKPLEPHKPQRDDEIGMSAMVKKYMWIGQSAAKPRTGERSTTNCRMTSYRSFEMVCPINSYIGEDIVWSHAKV